MIKTRQETIDGKVVSVTQLPARRAIKLKARLLKLLAPSLGSLFEDAKAGKSVAEVNVTPAAFGKAIERLAITLQPEEFESVILEVMSSTKVDNSDVSSATIDLMFGGELLFMYKVIWFSIKVQFEDFFGNSGIGKFLQKIPQAQTQPTV